ncbi:MAG: hypothetical protein ACK41W_11140 [Cyanobacteriota bacterium]
MRFTLDLMRSFLRDVCVPLAAGTLLLGAVPQASQALMRYSAKGPSISGSLGGVPFTHAPWSLTATADEALAAPSIFTVPHVGTFDLWWLRVSPKVRIQTLAAELEANLLDAAPFRWLALSGNFPVGFTPKIGFVYTTMSFQPETAAGLYGVPGTYVNLKSPFQALGPAIFENNTYPTTAGPLVITASAKAPGTFRIDAVPGPLPVLAAAGALSWSRRLRARLARARRTG